MMPADYIYQDRAIIILHSTLIRIQVKIPWNTGSLSQLINVSNVSKSVVQKRLLLQRGSKSIREAFSHGVILGLCFISHCTIMCYSSGSKFLWNLKENSKNLIIYFINRLAQIFYSFFSACVRSRFAVTHYNLHQPSGLRPRGFQNFNINLMGEF
jgi:hypothetical protein